MKFLSDVLAKAGLVVDGVVTLNNTATGQTPDANDNSTKLATTAWVRGFVTPYSLPIASASTLGGVKVGSGLAIDGTGILSVSASGVGAIRALQQITATSGQTVFTVSGGYTPGLIDVFLNGVLLTSPAITASNGTTFTLTDPAVANDLLDIFVYNPIYNGFITSTDQVPEGSVNLYYTNTRARAAISLTVTGSSGASTYNSSTGVLNVPTYTLAGLGGVPTDRTLTIDGVTYDLTANRTWNILPIGGAAGDILAKNSATNYDVTWIPNFTSTVKHVVKAAVALTIGQAVYVSSADGTNMIVSKASNASEQTSSKTLGLVAQNLAINDQGFVVTEGLLAGLDTSTANAGDPVWLGTNGNLLFGLLNKPYAPAHLVFIGVVTRVQQNNGEIFVKVQNGFELDELHDLSVKNPSDGDMIKYVASTGLWTKIAATTTNITEGTNLYYTDARVSTYLTTNGYATQTYVNTAVSNLVDAAPSTLDTLNELAAALGDDPNFATTVATSIGTKVPQTRTLTINGTSYDLSADRSWTIASGVTSFNTRTGAITSASGDYTTAQVTESGNLYYTDARARLAISLTTTGTSGAATYDSVTGVLNIPQYQGGVTSFNTRTGAITLSSTDVTTALGYTPVTNARTLTINGEAYDLTADRTWTIGVNPSARTIQTYTATASQTTFTVTGGYTVGLVDVFINGVRLTSSDFVATNGTTVVLTVGTMAGNIVDIIKYTSGIVNSISGSGTTNELAYFTASTTIASLTTATYPSLTELSYVKGVTSSIQTQLNGKQSTLTNPVTGTGTTNYLPKFTGASTIGNSQVIDNGTQVAVGQTPNSSYGTLQIKSPSSAYTLDLVGRNAGLNSDSQISFWNSFQSSVLASIGNSGSNLYLATGTNQPFTLSSGGNFLFGTTTDQGQRLLVQGTGGTTGFTRFTDGVTAAMFIGINSGTPFIHSNNSTLSFGASGANTFSPTMTLSSGNVGIGTANPDIFGFGSAGKYLTLQSNSGGFSLIQVISDGTSGSGINFGNSTIRRASIDALNGSHLEFYTNGSNSGTSVSARMRIT